MELALEQNQTEESPYIDDIDQKLIAAIQNGLQISDRPYATISNLLGVSENEVIKRISDLIESGLIKRFGVVVRHHELGYRQNAMIVWDVPDKEVYMIAQRMKSWPFITLCYRRARQLPEWQYNLYCMIHGKSRKDVLLHIENMVKTHNLENYPYEVLFSKRRFKQRAANYI